MWQECLCSKSPFVINSLQFLVEGNRGSLSRPWTMASSWEAWLILPMQAFLQFMAGIQRATFGVSKDVGMFRGIFLTFFLERTTFMLLSQWLEHPSSFQSGWPCGTGEWNGGGKHKPNTVLGMSCAILSLPIFFNRIVDCRWGWRKGIIGSRSQFRLWSPTWWWCYGGFGGWTWIFGAHNSHVTLDQENGLLWRHPVHVLRIALGVKERKVSSWFYCSSNHTPAQRLVSFIHWVVLRCEQAWLFSVLVCQWHLNLWLPWIISHVLCCIGFRRDNL